MSDQPPFSIPTDQLDREAIKYLVRRNDETLSAIARRLDLSRSAVSIILSAKDHRFKESTMERVEQELATVSGLELSEVQRVTREHSATPPENDPSFHAPK